MSKGIYRILSGKIGRQRKKFNVVMWLCFEVLNYAHSEYEMFLKSNAKIDLSLSGIELRKATNKMQKRLQGKYQKRIQI